MKKIQFVEDVELEAFGPVGHPDNPKFAQDQVETMRNDQAERWLRREKAVLLEDLGPDVLADADPGKVEEIREAVVQQHDTTLEDLATNVATARAKLTEALG